MQSSTTHYCLQARTYRHVSTSLKIQLDIDVKELTWGQKFIYSTDYIDAQVYTIHYTVYLIYNAEQWESQLQSIEM